MFARWLQLSLYLTFPVAIGCVAPPLADRVCETGADCIEGYRCLLGRCFEEDRCSPEPACPGGEQCGGLCVAGPGDVEHDAGLRSSDGGEASDAGLVDAGLADAGGSDAGAIETGVDAGETDAGEVDAGEDDAGEDDAGASCDDPTPGPPDDSLPSPADLPAVMCVGDEGHPLELSADGLFAVDNSFLLEVVQGTCFENAQTLLTIDSSELTEYTFPLSVDQLAVGTDYHLRLRSTSPPRGGQWAGPLEVREMPALTVSMGIVPDDPFLGGYLLMAGGNAVLTAETDAEILRWFVNDIPFGLQASIDVSFPVAGEYVVRAEAEQPPCGVRTVENTIQVRPCTQVLPVETETLTADGPIEFGFGGAPKLVCGGVRATAPFLYASELYLESGAALIQGAADTIQNAVLFARAGATVDLSQGEVHDAVVVREPGVTIISTPYNRPHVLDCDELKFDVTAVTAACP